MPSVAHSCKLHWNHVGWSEQEEPTITNCWGMQKPFFFAPILNVIGHTQQQQPKTEQKKETRNIELNIVILSFQFVIPTYLTYVIYM